MIVIGLYYLIGIIIAGIIVIDKYGHFDLDKLPKTIGYEM